MRARSWRSGSSGTTRATATTCAAPAGASFRTSIDGTERAVSPPGPSPGIGHVPGGLVLYRTPLSTARQVGSEGTGYAVPGGAIVAAVLVVLWNPIAATGQPRPSTPATTRATSTPTPQPGCSLLGAPCGHCGPVGQCLEHVDARPPSRVCVDGGFCVQVGCSADAQCDPGQVCATLGDIAACCVPCP